MFMNLYNYMSNNLTLEQEFKLAVVRKKLQNLNISQSRLYLLELLRLMMIKDNMIKYSIKNRVNFDLID
uniref:Uncharacterized protein ycf18 n=1 Tax=Compsopogon caeruleus TaxID=31354 RepID=A0A1Z1XB58_9RHOD|nr:phycobilisome degradation protein [Compsopogon caeruleus]ARX96056.1 phycobilisome degradation protein [Compsopogon caeruleus]